MRTCGNCGRLVADEAATACPQCGAALPGVAPDRPQPWGPQPPAGPAGYPPSYPQSGYGFGAPAGPSQPMYPPATGPGYPSGGYAPTPDAPPPPQFPPVNYGQPAAPLQPMYPYGGYPPQPAAPSQPMYPYGAYTPGAPPSPYGQAPGANWRPAAQKSGMPLWLIVTLVIALVAILTAGVGYGAYALTANHGGQPPNSGGASATATPNPASVLLNDPLTSNENGWSEGSHCFFDANGYHVVSAANESWLCIAPIGEVGDARISVTVAQLAGKTVHPFGISFRYTKSVGRYFFAIDAESEWALFRHVGDRVVRLHDYTSSPALHGGLHATNVLTVEFRGQQITCSANGTQLGVVNDKDTELGSGEVALEAANGANVLYSNFVAEQ